MKINRRKGFKIHHRLAYVPVRIQPPALWNPCFSPDLPIVLHCLSSCGRGWGGSRQKIERKFFGLARASLRARRGASYSNAYTEGYHHHARGSLQNQGKQNGQPCGMPMRPSVKSRQVKFWWVIQDLNLWLLPCGKGTKKEKTENIRSNLCWELLFWIEKKPFFLSLTYTRHSAVFDWFPFAEITDVW